MQYDKAVLPVLKKSHDGVVCIAVRHRVNGMQIESQWGARFSMLTRPAPKLIHPPVQWVASLLQGLKWPQCGAEPSPSTRLQMGQCYIPTSPLFLLTDAMK
jgi:hypothetical protein